MNELFSLARKVALVTGAAGHLGSALSRALAEAGATVVLNGRDGKKLESLEKNLSGQGLAAWSAPFDVRDVEAVERFRDRLMQREHRLDILVNNAYSGEPGDLESATRGQFAGAYEMSVTSAFELIRILRPCLIDAASRAGDASIINVASMYASVSPDPRIYAGLPPNPPFYGPAKAGLLQLTRYLACSLAPEGIRVNALSPGPFPSAEVARDQPGFVDRLRGKTPLGRCGTPDDLKGAIVFLASSASRYVTGINLPVDGGWTTW